jgi:hypothetical protein
MTPSSTARCRRTAFIALLALLATAPAPTASRTAQPTGDVTLAWDPNTVATSGYRVHVGTESRVYYQVYDVGRATSFVFEDPAPGTRYYFAVTAYDADGQESAFSNEVSYLIGDEPEPPVMVQSPDSPALRETPGARVRADALGPVSGILALPDGRVLFVEGARHVRALGPRGLVAAPALSIDESEAGFTELVADPSFARTALVFVGMTQLRKDGRQDFWVVRYRLVGPSLGEGATVVGGLSFSGDDAPRFAVDDLGRIYVAMPGAGTARADAYAGRLLRYAPDGSVPTDHRGMSPILAYSFAIPLDLDWDGRAVWVVGRDERAQPSLGRLLPDAADDEWPRRLSAGVGETASALDVTAFDVVAPTDAKRSTAQAVIVDTTHRLHRVTAPTQGAVPQVEAVDWSAEARPVDVALGPYGQIYVVVRTATGQFAIVEVPDR